MSSAEIIVLKGRIDALTRCIDVDTQMIGKIKAGIIGYEELRTTLGLQLERLCGSYEELNEKGEYL